MAYWARELEKVNQCDQRQDSLNDQILDLIKIANRFGFYDAADYLEFKHEDRGFIDKDT